MRSVLFPYFTSTSPFSIWRDLDDEFSELQKKNSLKTVLSSHENDEAYLVSVDLPGVNQEDISIDVASDSLQVKAVRKHHFGKKDDAVFEYSKSFIIPNDVEKSKIQAHYENGVLMLALPKKEEEKPQKIEISSDGQSNSWKSLLGFQKNTEKAS